MGYDIENPVVAMAGERSEGKIGAGDEYHRFVTSQSLHFL